MTDSEVMRQDNGNGAEALVQPIAPLRLVTPPLMTPDQEEQKRRRDDVRARLLRAFTATQDQRPDDVGEFYRALRERGIPETEARRLPPPAEWRDMEQRQERQLNAIAALPYLSEWISDPHNMGISRDDLEPLIRLERAFHSASRDTFGDLGKSFAGGGAQLYASGGYGLVAAGVGDLRFLAEQTAAAEKMADEWRRSRSVSSQLFWRDLEATEGFWDTIGVLWEDWGGTTQGIIENLPMMAPALIMGGAGMKGGAAVGSLAGPKGVAVGGAVGLAGGTFTGVYVTEYGARVSEYLRRNKVDVTDPDALYEAFLDEDLMNGAFAEAGGKALGTSTVEALTALIGVGAATRAAGRISRQAGRMRLGLPAERPLFGRAANAVQARSRVLAPLHRAGDPGSRISRFTRGAGRFIVHTAGESVGEAVGEATGELMATGEISVKEATLEAVFGLGQSVGQAGLAQVGGGTMRAMRLAAAAVKDHQVALDIGEAHRESKAAGRDQEAVAKFVADAAQARDMGILRIPVADWARVMGELGLDPRVEAAEAAVGGLRAFEDAEASGDLIVPFHAVLARYGAADAYERLMEVAAQRPGGLSLTEAGENARQALEQLKESQAAAEEGAPGLTPGEAARMAELEAAVEPTEATVEPAELPKGAQALLEEYRGLTEAQVAEELIPIHEEGIQDAQQVLATEPEGSELAQAAQAEIAARTRAIAELRGEPTPEAAEPAAATDDSRAELAALREKQARAAAEAERVKGVRQRNAEYAPQAIDEYTAKIQAASQGTGALAGEQAARYYATVVVRLWHVLSDAAGKDLRQTLAQVRFGRGGPEAAAQPGTSLSQHIDNTAMGRAYWWWNGELHEVAERDLHEDWALKNIPETAGLKPGGDGELYPAAAKAMEMGGIRMRVVLRGRGLVIGVHDLDTRSLREIQTAVSRLPEGTQRSVDRVAVNDIGGATLDDLLLAKSPRDLAQRARLSQEAQPFDGPEVAKTPLGDATEVDGKPALNSEGRPIHWSVEGVRNFWRWFGDSKVVDGQGRPLVLYHGTRAPKPFDVFSERPPVPRVHGAGEIGFFFSDQRDEANFFASLTSLHAIERGVAGTSVMPVYVRMQNPQQNGTAFQSRYIDTTRLERAANLADAKESGFDGLVGRSDTLMGTSYVAFSPEQIKSAIGNVGAFGPGKSILEQRAEEPDHKREKSGRYIGAPDRVGKSKNALNALRRVLHKLALEGEPGRYWYERSSEAILALAGGNKAEAELIVGLIAIYSPNATVAANTTMALTAYYQWKAGLPINAGYNTADVKAEELLRQGKPWSGIKTNSFYQNLMVYIDPSKLGDAATMDMWMAIAFDYGSKSLDQGPKYKFAEREIQYLAAQLGWAPHQVQAAIWTATKSRVDPIRKKLRELDLKRGYGKMVPGKPREDGTIGPPTFKLTNAKAHFRLAHKLAMAADLDADSVAASKYDFSDALEERAVQMSWEATPGASTGDLPGIHRATTQQKMEYLAAVAKVLFEGGEDVIAKRLGLPAGRRLFGFSAWEGDIGAGAQTFIPAPSAGSGAERAVRPIAREALNSYAAVLGYVLRQDAVVWHAPVYADAKIRHNGVDIRTPRPLTEDEMRQLYGALIAKFGTAQIAPGYTPNGARLLNFVEGLENKAFQKGVLEVLESLPDDFGGGAIEKVSYRSDGEYIGNDWQESPDGEGYVQAGFAGRPDLQEWAAGLRARVEAVGAEFASRYGWDQPTGPAAQPGGGAPGVGVPQARLEQRRREAIRGTTSFGAPDQFGQRILNIEIWKEANASTITHEMMHAYGQALGDMASAPDATPEIKAMYAEYLRVSGYGTREAHVGAMDEIGRIYGDAARAGRKLNKKERARVKKLAANDERMADSFIAYKMEGKAPTSDLQTLFDSFRDWLVAVYKHVKNIGVELTADARLFFDRILTTEEQFAEAREVTGEVSNFENREQAGMTEEEWNAHQAKVKAADDAVKRELDRQNLAALRKEEREAREKKREAYKAEALAALEQTPAVIALELMRTGKMPDGSPPPAEGPRVTKINRKSVRERYGPASPQVRTLESLGVLQDKGGADIRSAANDSGYASAEAFIEDLRAAANREVVAAVMASQRLAEENRAMLEQRDGTDRAVRADATNERSEVMYAELLAGQKQLRKQERATKREAGKVERLKEQVRDLKIERRVEDNIRKRAVRDMPKLAEYRTAAESRLAGMSVREIKPHHFRIAMGREMRRAARAVRQGAWYTFVDAQSKALLNHELYRLSLKALEQRRKRVTWFRKLVDPKGRRRKILIKASEILGRAHKTTGHAFEDEVMALLEQFDLGRMSDVQRTRRKGLENLLRLLESDGYPIIVPTKLVLDNSRIPIDDLTLGQIEELYETLTGLYTVAQNAYAEAKSSRGELLAETDKALAAQVRRSKPVDKPKFKPEESTTEKRIRRAGAFLQGGTVGNTIARIFDEHEDGGLWQTYLTRRANEATDRAERRKRLELRAYVDLYKQHFTEQELKNFEKQENFAGAWLSHEARLTVLSLYGREEGRQRLANILTEEQIAAVLASFTERDVAFVRARYEFFDALFKDGASMWRRLTGQNPKPAARAPFTITTTDGKQVSLEGGYHPLSYRETRRFQPQDLMKDMKRGGASAVAQLETGFFKAAVPQYEGRPRLDRGVVISHINDIVHTIEMRETILDLQAILSGEEVFRAIHDHYGENTYDLLKSWLHDLAYGTRAAVNSAESAGAIMRQGAVTARLGFRPLVAIKQWYGLRNTVITLGGKGGSIAGTKLFLKTMGRLFSDLETLRDAESWMRSMSLFMDERPEGTWQREMNELRLGGVTWVKNLNDLGAFYMVMKSQFMVDMLTWYAAFDKAMAAQPEGVTVEEWQKEAAAQADQLVKDTQHGGQPVDLSEWERGGPLLRLFTTYFTDGVLKFNQTRLIWNRTNFKDAGSAIVFVADMALLYWFQAAMATVLAMLVGGEGEDDEYEWGKKMIGMGLAELLDTLVFVREATGIVQGYPYRGTAGMGVVGAFGQAWAQISQGELDWALVRSMNMFLGHAIGYPAQAIQELGYAADQVFHGEIPTALVGYKPKR